MADSQRKTANLFDIEKWLTDRGVTYTKSGNAYTFYTDIALNNNIFYFSESNIYVSISGIMTAGTVTDPQFKLVTATGGYAENNVINPTKSKTEGVLCAGIRLDWNNGGSLTLNNIMLNTGSTALPYEPYGWLHSLRKLTTATEAVENPLYSDGTAITSYTIKGNTVQDGTPTPSNPVDVNGVGVRTENLVDISTYTASGGQSSKYEYFRNVTLSAGTYTFSCRQNNTLSYATRNTLFVAIDANLTYESTATDYHLNVGLHSLTFTLASNQTIILGYWTNTLSNDCVYDEFMLNVGSTAKPYEPYGYKIPISSGGENLFDGNYVNAYLTTTGRYNYPDNTTKSIIVKCEPNTTYTIKQLTYVDTGHKWRIAVFNSMPTHDAVGTPLVNDDSLSESTITTLNDSAYIVVYYMFSTPTYDAEFMINLSSTPVYLGSTQTVRQIKKLVLTGQESYTFDSTRSQIIFYVTGAQRCIPICTHYKGKLVSGWGELANGEIAFHPSDATTVRICDTSITSADNFKTYLQQQYAAGTPVTVWYVLANPETATVNEPLMKIGTYADTLSNAMSIPTTEGANSITVDTTVQPSEFTATWTGWHDAYVKEYTSDTSIADLENVSVSQMENHTIQELQGGNWS